MAVSAPEKNSDEIEEETPPVEKILSDSKQDSEMDSFTREIHNLQKDIETERQRSSDLANRMRYLQADMANLQRQSDRRVSEVRSQVKLTWLLEIITIKEDLDRAIGVALESDKKSILIDGLYLISSRIENILKLEEVKVVPAEVGGRFDPNLHEALSFKETESKQGTILSIISPGYSVEGKVIKPAMVEVSKHKEKKSAGERSKSTENDISKESGVEVASDKKDP